MPDLLETKNKVFVRSTRSANDLIWAGSVESSTCSLGQPGRWPNDLAITSGQRLEPPMPRTIASEKPASFTSRAKFVKRRMLRCCSSMIDSHPSHLSSSSPVQSEVSPAQSRRTLSFASQSFRVDSTAAANSLRQGESLLIDVAGHVRLSIRLGRVR